ncbi:hypothetical protein [Paenibacillus odorifer]|uniref:hypothetical protein n=1 Tax=Paenibacillus odorifer TaxID=189426 RepID=UPI0020BFA5A5|nr:hypothetical protein [Paenibacillus odorifer]
MSEEGMAKEGIRESAYCLKWQIKLIISLLLHVKRELGDAYWCPAIESGFIQYSLARKTSCICLVRIENHLRG